MNPLIQLQNFGQSIWVDSISRSMIESGELARFIADDGVRGVTSNPSIFEKAIAEGTEYRALIAKLRAEDPAASAMQLYEAIAIRDIQSAADLLLPVYRATETRDGYVSLEVTLQGGSGKAEILSEARHLWRAVARPNVMIKVPGSDAGIAAFEELIGEGINVNVTLLFAVDVYARVAEAYLAGMEALAKRGGDSHAALSRTASVASFFVSRIDTAADKLVEERLAAAKSPRERFFLRSVLGKTAIANAKLAYAHYQRTFSGERLAALAKKGARVQRVLWASTGTKNKRYSDVMYVEELIGHDTVNTAPTATIAAFRDHGRSRLSIVEDLDAAPDTIAAFESLGVPLEEITDRLLAEGLKLFSDAFDKLLGTIESSKGAPPLASARIAFPESLRSAQERELDDWTAHGNAKRVWDRDAKLWTGADEGKWLGWLDAPAYAKTQAAELQSFARGIRGEGFRHVLLLGMGGSSLCPEVLQHTFGAAEGYPSLEVVDSTDPAQIRHTEARLDLARTLVVVASKSGSTLEPSIFESYFWERVVAVSGKEKAGRQFVAITDPGSKLEALAKEKQYRRIFAGVPSIGGRFSALSNFGLVPGALIGLDLAKFSSRAQEMALLCQEPDARKNPGVALGVALGVAAREGRDKLTLVMSPALMSLGAWLEQLIAESTGKFGKGIVPFDLEPLTSVDRYGDDRVFAYVQLASPKTSYERLDRAQERLLEALERAGHPVIRISMGDVHDLGAEFFRWEFATAVAGAVLKIHPFDQPDVEASKIATRALTDEYEKKGSLPEEKPFFAADDFELYADARNAHAIEKALGAEKERGAGIEGHLRALLAQAKRGDYFGVLAWFEMSRDAEREYMLELLKMRMLVRDACKIATAVEFGPRFLHSTGQAYKGGPNTGIFLQLTADVEEDLPVPGRKYTFGIVRGAQARGDFQVLAERGRRALRVHIRGDLQRGLERLRESLSRAVAEHAQLSS